MVLDFSNDINIVLNPEMKKLVDGKCPFCNYKDPLPNGDLNKIELMYIHVFREHPTKIEINLLSSIVFRDKAVYITSLSD